MTGLRNSWGLAWKLARREMRAGLTGFKILIACLALGTASIAAVGVISQSVTAGLSRDGQALLGGDVSFRKTHIAPEPDHLQFWKNRAENLSSIATMRAMASLSSEPTRRSLVELKGVDSLYPLYGQIGREPAIDLQAAFAQSGEVWGGLAEQPLMAKLGLEVGDTVRVGGATIEIRAVITREPDKVASVMNFGPRLMVAQGAIEASGLIRPGSQVRYVTRLALPPGTSGKALVEDFKETFPDTAYRIQTTDNAAPGVQRFIDRLTLFLTFVGLTAVLVGGIGVGNAVAAYLDRKTANIATYKSLGAPSEFVVQLYLTQVAMLSALGISIGILLGGIAPIIGLTLAKDLFPVEPVIGLYPGPLGLAAAFGFCIAWTFALWPLGRAALVKPAGLFRAAVQPLSGQPPTRYMIAIGLGLAALASLTLAAAHNPKFAVWFILGAIITFIVLKLAANAITFAAKHLPVGGSATARLVLANLHRPGNATTSVVLSVGLGLTVLIAVGLIEANLNRQIDDNLPDRAPAFFFLDVQPHQVADFDKAVMSVEGAQDYQRVPSLRGRIVKIAGTPVADVEIAQDARWAVRGDRALTYSAKPRESSKIVSGAWWPEDYTGPPLISLDADLARGFGVDLGDSLTLNVLGREIEAEIASLRDIDWGQVRFDFAIIFAPGTLEGAPHSHIAAVHVPADREDAMDAAIAVGFDNVSAIRVRDALEQASNMLAGIGWAVRATALFTLLTGALVLAGAVAATHRRRTFEAVVYKVLGAGRRRVMTLFLLEYGLLSLATALASTILGVGISWVITTQWMGLDWVLQGLPIIIATLISLLAVLGLGLLGTRQALDAKPLQHLRNA